MKAHTIKKGDPVFFTKASGNKGGPYRVASIEMHNDRKFFRLKGFPASLFIRSSITQ